MKFELLGKLRDDEDSSSGSSGGGLPVDEVTRLSEQGYAETEIIEQLRDRGYSYGDINEALNAAVKESASQQGGMGGGNMSQGGQGQGQNPASNRGSGQNSWDEGGNDWEPQQGQSFNEQQSQPQQPAPQPEPQPQYEDDYYEGDDDWGAMSVSPEEEELIEIIVQEHMADVENELEQFRTELEQLRNDFQQLRQDFNEIDIRKDEDEKVVIQKVNEMEEYFEQTSSRMGGMEKALQQVLPSLVENVRDLSSVVREMKEEQR